MNLKELIKRIENDEYVAPKDVVEAVEYFQPFGQGNYAYDDWEKLKKLLGVG